MHSEGTTWHPLSLFHVRTKSDFLTGGSRIHRMTAYSSLRLISTDDRRLVEPNRSVSVSILRTHHLLFLFLFLFLLFFSAPIVSAGYTFRGRT